MLVYNQGDDHIALISLVVFVILGTDANNLPSTVARFQNFESLPEEALLLWLLWIRDSYSLGS